MNPPLTRSPSRYQPERWQVRYGEVPIGSYGPFERKAGEVRWSWAVGFTPGCLPKQMQNGQADSEDEARAALSAAWEALRPQLSDDQFEDWRQYSRRQAWILQMRARGLRLPTMNADGRAACFCGASLTIADSEEHIRTVHGEMRA